MKKYFVIIFISLLSYVSYSQEINEATYEDKKETVKALSFESLACDKNTIINTWKDYIKNHNGKISGGIINKIKGLDLKFVNSTSLWEANFVYNTTDVENGYRLFFSYKDFNGNYLNQETNPELYQEIIDELKVYKETIVKNCTTQELIDAIKYKGSLINKKYNNISKIANLNKAIETSKLDIEIEKVKNRKSSDSYINDINRTIDRNQKNIDNLNDEIPKIDQDVLNQEKVIRDIKEKLDLYSN